MSLFKRRRPDVDEFQKTPCKRERPDNEELPICYRCGRQSSEELKNAEYWCAWCGQSFNIKDAATYANSDQEDVTQTASGKNEHVECFVDSGHSNDKTPEEDTKRNLYAKCIYFFQSGKYKKALGCFKEKIMQDPSNAEGWFYIGRCNTKLDCWHEAVDAFKQAIQKKSDYVEAYCDLGVAYVRLGHHQEAEAAFKQVIHIKPNDAFTYFRLGVAHSELSHYKEAIEAYKRALQINPNHADARQNIGVEFDTIECIRLKEAIDAYKEYLKVECSGCSALILPSTAKENKGLCKQCFHGPRRRTLSDSSSKIKERVVRGDELERALRDVARDFEQLGEHGRAEVYRKSARLARETLNEKQLWTYYGGKIDLDKPLPLATWGDRIIRAHHIRAWIRELEIVLLEAARDFEQIEKHNRADIYRKLVRGEEGDDLISAPVSQRQLNAG